MAQAMTQDTKAPPTADTTGTVSEHYTLDLENWDTFLTIDSD